MRVIKRIPKLTGVRLFLWHLISLTMIFIISITGCTLSQAPSDALLSSCEKAIHLYYQKPEKIVSNETGYSLHFKYHDEFPSRKAFWELNRQLTECGWKQYDTLKFTVNDADWTRYLKGYRDEDTVVIHSFARTYIDKQRKTLALLLLMYVSKPSDIKEALYINTPNNNIQWITIQFWSFNEEDARKKIEEYDKQLR